MSGRTSTRPSARDVLIVGMGMAGGMGAGWLLGMVVQAVTW